LKALDIAESSWLSERQKERTTLKRISVALATYNGSRFLREQLESLAYQTRLPDELVVCDDGSSDDTVDIVSQFARTARFPVREHRNERNLGYADNFLRAATLCSGDIIAFCDQDDVWARHKLDVVESAFERYDPVLLVHAGRLVNAELVPLRHQMPRIARSRCVLAGESNLFALYPGFAMCFSAELFRVVDWQCRLALESLVDVGTPLPHDEWIAFLAFSSGRVTLLAEELVLYRMHEGNLKGSIDWFSSRAFIRRASAAGSDVYVRSAKLAGERADFLAGMVAAADAPVRENLRRSIAWYRSLHGVLELRARLHDRGQAPKARASAFMQLLRSGSYRSRTQGGVGPRSFLKDATVFSAVLARPC
jgi:glycosyltransferase involved in cell wall biosynthesis